MVKDPVWILGREREEGWDGTVQQCPGEGLTGQVEGQRQGWMWSAAGVRALPHLETMGGLWEEV